MLARVGIADQLARARLRLAVVRDAAAMLAIYAPIVFALVSLQRWIERRRVAAEAVA